MRATWYLLPLLIVNVGFAQETSLTQPFAEQTSAGGDPTVPSAKIRERLAGDVPAIAIPAVPTPPIPASPLEKSPDPLPDFDLKAIVMSDVNHGTALLQCNGRTIVVPLLRAVKSTSASSPSTPEKKAHSARSRLQGFTFQGQTYTVEDFSSTTLLLKTGNRTHLVQ